MNTQKYSDEEYLKIVRSNPAGYTTHEIADRIGVNPVTALHHLHRLEKNKQLKGVPIGRRQIYGRSSNPRGLVWIMPPDPIPRLVKAVARELYPEQFKKQTL